MSLRVKILCLLVLATFAGLAFAYYKFYVVSRTHGVILLIVPGLNLELLNQSGIDPETGAGSPPRLTWASQVALVSNQTESGKANPAAIFSWLATSKLGLADQLGLSPDGRPLDNLLYAAQRAGRATGLVSNSTLDNPVLAAFYAHQISYEDRPSVARQLFDSTDINVMLGELPPSFATLKETTGRDLIEEAQSRGVRVINLPEELDDLSPWWTLRSRLLGVFQRPPPPPPPSAPAPSAKKNTKKETSPPPPAEPPLPPPPSMPSLTTLITKAIQILQYHWRGYFLVVHADLRETSDPSVRTQNVLEHIRELNKAIQSMRAWAGKNSTIILYVPYDLPSREEKAPSSNIPTKPNTARSKKAPAPPPSPPSPPKTYPTVPAGFGWVAIYGKPLPLSRGFLTLDELHRLILSQL